MTRAALCACLLGLGALACGEVLLPDAGTLQDAGPALDAALADAEPAEDAALADADAGPTDSGDVAPDAGPTDAMAPPSARLRLGLEGEGEIRVRAPSQTCNAPCEVTVPVGDTVELTAAPATHWRFVAWSTPSCPGPVCEVTIVADVELTATFERVEYPLSVNLAGGGAGTVTSTAVGLACPAGACAVDVESETRVALRATPAAGSTFAGWTGACAGLLEACAVAMDGARSVTATFEPVLATIQIRREGDAAADGLVQGAGGSLACPAQCTASLPVGVSVTLGASTSINTAVFDGWPSGPCAGQGASCTFTVQQGLPPVAAAFARNRLTVSTSGEPGRVTSDVGGIDCGASCAAVLPVGAAVTLTAQPATNDQRFDSWTGACAGQGATCTLTLNGPDATDATFIVRPPPVTDHQAADLVLGQPNFNTDLPNNGGEGLATLNRPRYCHTDGTRLWVSDGDNARVLQWNTLPTQTMQPADVVIGQASPTQHTAGTTQSTLQTGVGKVVRVSSGGLYVADLQSSRVLYWSVVPSVDGANATAVIGQSSFTMASRALGASLLDQPYAVEVAGSRLLIADSFNNRVVVHDTLPTSTGLVAADHVLGQFDAQGQPSLTQGLAPSPPTASTMNRPFDVHYDPVTDRLFVVDTNNHRVLGYNGYPSTPRPADFVLGQASFTGNAVDAGQGGTNAVGFSGPRVAYVHAGSLFVSDGGNSRVMVWTPVPGSTGAPATAVLGKPDLTTRGAGTSARDMTGPWGICAAGNRLFVTDISDSRVLGFTLTP